MAGLEGTSISLSFKIGSGKKAKTQHVTLVRSNAFLGCHLIVLPVYKCAPLHLSNGKDTALAFVWWQARMATIKRDNGRPPAPTGSTPIRREWKCKTY